MPPSVLRDKRKINEAVDGCGYAQREVADYLEMYFTSVNRIVRGIGNMLIK